MKQRIARLDDIGRGTGNGRLGVGRADRAKCRDQDYTGSRRHKCLVNPIITNSSLKMKMLKRMPSCSIKCRRSVIFGNTTPIVFEFG